MSLLLLFIDGVGLGGSAGNPLREAHTLALDFDADAPGSYGYRGGVLRAADANLGVEGLPQSATGQTAIFTGVNAPLALGRHKSGWPTGELRALLRGSTIFSRLIGAGADATFANAFTPVYFLRPVSRMSASTLHMLYAGIAPRWIWQIPHGEAVFQDFTNGMLIDAGFDLPRHGPEDAAATLAGMLERHDFVLYEYFLTDAAAHERIPQSAREIIEPLDRMIVELLDRADLERHCVALVSDHGNIEDSSTRSHTRNPVPLIAWGRGAPELFAGVNSIAGIADAFCKRLVA